MTSSSTFPDEKNQKSIRSPAVKRNLHVLIISASLLGAAMTLHRSLMQPLVLQLGGSITIVGVVTSISSLAMMVPMLLGGEYSDSVGRRRPMILASLFLVVAGLIFWGATHWVIIIPAVLLAGFAVALNGPASLAATTESIAKTHRGRAFAYRGSGRLLAGVIATFLGIIVVQRSIKPAFLLFTLFALINLVVIYFLLKETHLSPRPFSSTRLLTNLRHNWRPPTQLKYLYLYMAVFDPLAFDVGWNLIYGLLSDFQGVSNQQILLYSMSAGALGGILQLIGIAGRFAEWSRKWSMVIADSIAIPSILLIALFPGEKMYLVSFLCMGLADAFFMPAIHAYVVDYVPPERVAAELGKFWSSRGIVSLFPPILGGLLAATYGYSAPLLFNVVVGFFGLLLLIWKL